MGGGEASLQLSPPKSVSPLGSEAIGLLLSLTPPKKRTPGLSSQPNLRSPQKSSDSVGARKRASSSQKSPAATKALDRDSDKVHTVRGPGQAEKSGAEQLGGEAAEQAHRSVIGERCQLDNISQLEVEPTPRMELEPLHLQFRAAIPLKDREATQQILAISSLEAAELDVDFTARPSPPPAVPSGPAIPDPVAFADTQIMAGFEETQELGPLTEERRGGAVDDRITIDRAASEPRQDQDRHRAAGLEGSTLENASAQSRGTMAASHLPRHSNLGADLPIDAAPEANHSPKADDMPNAEHPDSRQFLLKLPADHGQDCVLRQSQRHSGTVKDVPDQAEPCQRSPDNTKELLGSNDLEERKASQHSAGHSDAEAAQRTADVVNPDQTDGMQLVGHGREPPEAIQQAESPGPRQQKLPPSPMEIREDDPVPLEHLLPISTQGCLGAASASMMADSEEGASQLYSLAYTQAEADAGREKLTVLFMRGQIEGGLYWANCQAEIDAIEGVLGLQTHLEKGRFGNLFLRKHAWKEDSLIGDPKADESSCSPLDSSDLCIEDLCQSYLATDVEVRFRRETLQQQGQLLKQDDYSDSAEQAGELPCSQQQQPDLVQQMSVIPDSGRHSSPVQPPSEGKLAGEKSMAADQQLQTRSSSPGGDKRKSQSSQEDEDPTPDNLVSSARLCAPSPPAAALNQAPPQWFFSGKGAEDSRQEAVEKQPDFNGGAKEQPYIPTGSELQSLPVPVPRRYPLPFADTEDESLRAPISPEVSEPEGREDRPASLLAVKLVIDSGRKRKGESEERGAKGQTRQAEWAAAAKSVGLRLPMHASQPKGRVQLVKQKLASRQQKPVRGADFLRHRRRVLQSSQPSWIAEKSNALATVAASAEKERRPPPSAAASPPKRPELTAARLDEANLDENANPNALEGPSAANGTAAQPGLSASPFPQIIHDSGSDSGESGSDEDDHSRAAQLNAVPLTAEELPWSSASPFLKQGAKEILKSAEAGRQQQQKQSKDPDRLTELRAVKAAQNPYSFPESSEPAAAAGAAEQNLPAASKKTPKAQVPQAKVTRRAASALARPARSSRQQPKSPVKTPRKHLKSPQTEPRTKATRGVLGVRLTRDAKRPVRFQDADSEDDQSPQQRKTFGVAAGTRKRVSEDLAAQQDAPRSSRDAVEVAEGRAEALGCSKCRFSKIGCKQCRDLAGKGLPTSARELRSRRRSSLPAGVGRPRKRKLDESSTGEEPPPPQDVPPKRRKQPAKETDVARQPEPSGNVDAMEGLNSQQQPGTVAWLPPLSAQPEGKGLAEQRTYYSGFCKNGEEVWVGDAVELQPAAGEDEPRIAVLDALWSNKKASNLKMAACTLFLRPKETIYHSMVSNPRDLFISDVVDPWLSLHRVVRKCAVCPADQPGSRPEGGLIYTCIGRFDTKTDVAGPL